MVKGEAARRDTTKDTLINRLITLPGFCLVGICDVVK